MTLAQLRAVSPGCGYSLSPTGHEYCRVLPQLLGVLQFSLPSPRCLRGEEEGLALGEGDAEGKGCAWDGLDLAKDSGRSSDISSQKEQLLRRPRQRGQGQELGRRAGRKSEKGREKGEGENPKRPKATQVTALPRASRTLRSSYRAFRSED